MTGVEILAMEEVIAAYKFSWLIYIGVIIVFGLIFCAINYFPERYPTVEDAIIGFIVGVVIGALVGLLPALYCIPSEYETQYKVTISDEVSMNDFISKYEIIEQEGKIYTVRERNE